MRRGSGELLMRDARCEICSPELNEIMEMRSASDGARYGEWQARRNHFTSLLHLVAISPMSDIFVTFTVQRLMRIEPFHGSEENQSPPHGPLVHLFHGDHLFKVYRVRRYLAVASYWISIV